MNRLARSLLLLALALSMLSPVGGAEVVRAAPNGPTGPSVVVTVAPAGYYDGMIQYSTITNCVSIIQGMPYQEYGAGSYVGFYADPNNGIPSVSSPYYIRVVVAGLGNACSGMRAYLEIALPASTSLAINAVNKVLCYYDGSALPALECPQTLSASSYNPGAYAIFSTDAAHANTWPIPQGHILEIRIPVTSSTALTASQMHANVWMLDGNSSPWLQPSQGVYVFSNTNSLFYATPSTTSITSTTAHSEVNLHSNGSGNIYFDLGTDLNYGYTTSPFFITGAGGWNLYVNWAGLAPNTLYHWRARYVPSSGSTVFGADQTIQTLPDGQATVGQGASADCTETALNAALASAPKTIVFNCGTQPVTINLTAAKTVTSNLVINGGNLVTLAFSGTGNHFNVQAGGNLTLSKITLSNGNASGCGGAVNVAAGGTLNLNGARLISNHSALQGGAVCSFGTLSVSNSLFNLNTAGSHGGAIGNYGGMGVTNSRFTGNFSSKNGGAIDTGSTVTISGTTFSGNSASWRGGGVNAYGANLTVATSMFDGNTAGIWGGGLASDASTTGVTTSTFSNNYTSGPGGGVEMSGVNTLNLTNVTLNANRAGGNGGGIYRDPTAGTGALTLLNVTFAANLSVGGTGGNISGGATAASISARNTLIVAGSPNNCDAAIGSQGYNLENLNSCGLAAAGDKPLRAFMLGALAPVSGSPTSVMPLLAGSPAIDGGTNTGCPATDQRGSSRPVDGNKDAAAVCDIGAYEAGPQAAKIYLPNAIR